MKGHVSFDAAGLQRPSPMRAHHAGAMGIVHDQQAFILVGEPCQCRERRQISIHAKQAVCDDERPANSGPSFEEPFEVVDIRVMKDAEPCSAEAAAVDHACMAEPIGQDDVLRAGQAGKEAQVGEIAGPEAQGRLGVLPFCQGHFQVMVRWLGSGDQACGACADPILPNCLGGRLLDGRMVGQAEIVVGRHEDEAAPLIHDLRRAGGLDDTALSKPMLCVKSGQFRLKEGIEFIHGGRTKARTRWRIGNGRRMEPIQMEAVESQADDLASHRFVDNLLRP